MSDGLHANGQNGPSTVELLVPTRWVRAGVYAIAWLPPLAVLIYLFPRFGPIFQKLDEGRVLPQLTYWVWTIARLNEAYFCLPAVLVLVILITAAESIMVVARRTRFGRIGWAAVVASAGLLAWFIIVK